MNSQQGQDDGPEARGERQFDAEREHDGDISTRDADGSK